MDPVAFKIGALTIHWYGVLVALGFLIGLWTASRRGLREGIAPEKIMDIGPWLIVGTIIGARTLHVISYWDEEFAGRPWTEVFMVQKGGLVYYGGFIGATLAGIIYLLWKKLPLWKFADVLAPSIPLGYVLGRIGCLMNGCCYGRTCDLPWAIRFPKEHSGTQGMPVHPTQLYDALLSAGLWLFLAWLFRRKRFDGQVFAAYLLGYAVLRSIVEFFRGDYSRHYLGWATPAHLVSIGIFSIGLILLWLLPKGTARPIRPAQSSTP